MTRPPHSRASLRVEQEALALALADLKVAVEAVADVLVAEGVHHITSGRAEAAGATFAAMASGSHPPLDLDVLREPRSGIAITNRLVLLLDETGGADGWDRGGMRGDVGPRGGAVVRRRGALMTSEYRPRRFRGRRYGSPGAGLSQWCQRFSRSAVTATGSVACVA